MRKHRQQIGNCPECGFACRTIGRGRTPRHGHVKNFAIKGWLPPCKGSGKPAVNHQYIT
jgi:hypothetical protein